MDLLLFLLYFFNFDSVTFKYFLVELLHLYFLPFEELLFKAQLLFLQFKSRSLFLHLQLCICQLRSHALSLKVHISLYLDLLPLYLAFQLIQFLFLMLNMILLPLSQVLKINLSNLDIVLSYLQCILVIHQALSLSLNLSFFVFYLLFGHPLTLQILIILGKAGCLLK